MFIFLLACTQTRTQVTRSAATNQACPDNQISPLICLGGLLFSLFFPSVMTPEIRDLYITTSLHYSSRTTSDAFRTAPSDPLLLVTCFLPSFIRLIQTFADSRRQPNMLVGMGSTSGVVGRARPCLTCPAKLLHLGSGSPRPTKPGLTGMLTCWIYNTGTNTSHVLLD